MPADEGTSSELVLQRLRVLSWHLIGAVIISCFSGFISRDGVKGGGGSSTRKSERYLFKSIQPITLFLVSINYLNRNENILHCNCFEKFTTEKSAVWRRSIVRVILRRIRARLVIIFCDIINIIYVKLMVATIRWVPTFTI